MSKVEKYFEDYIKNFKSAKVNKWCYEDGCVLLGAIKMYQATGKDLYKKFVFDVVDQYVNEDGTMNFYDNKKYHIDNIYAGNALFFAYDETGNEKYRKAIELQMEQLRNHPRTASGNFFHKDIYPNQVWLDGINMGLVFYMNYETRFGGKEHYQDIMNQLRNVRKNAYNEEKGLYYHAYDESKQMAWADKETGCSPNFWLRAMGWYMVALIDMIEGTDQAIYENYDELKRLFKEALKGLLQYQDKDSKLFYQVIDRADVEGNYLETSGSLMIAYAMLKACRMKVILSEKYEKTAREILDSVIDNKLVEENGKLALTDMCLVAGLSDTRDGSVEYYLSEERGSDDHKGVGALMMAYAESILLK